MKQPTEPTNRKLITVIRIKKKKKCLDPLIGWNAQSFNIKNNLFVLSSVKNNFSKV